jgi:hemolysin activation/secretion protein
LIRQIQLFFFLFFPFFLLASNNETYINQREIILQNLKGIILSGDSYPPPDYIIKTTKGVLFYRIAAPKNISHQVLFAKNLERRAINRALTFEDIEEYKKDIADYFLKYCNMHVSVILPEQECTLGIIILKIIPSKLGEVSVTGNYWFSKEHYLKYITTEKSDVIDSNKLVANLNRINSSPWQKADLVYKSGKYLGQTDIELVVTDKKPIQFYAGVDNTGFKVTQYSRIYVGFNWGNAFDLDQNIAFCYTASPNFSGYQSYTLNYLIPLPNTDSLRFYGGYARLSSQNEILNQAVDTGQSWQVSSRYEFCLPQSKTLNQSFDLGIDYKSTNNDFIVGENDQISNRYATVFELAAKYKGGIHFKNHIVDGNVGIFAQPWKLFNSMSDSAYCALREGSKPIFLYLRGDGIYSYNELNEGSFAGKIKIMGQLSSSALIPIEQFGLGGINSVRGYVEREVNVDSALVFNFDVRSPKISLFKYISKKDRNLDKLSGVLFLDIGNGWIYNPVLSQPSYYILAGLGPGVRYDIANNIYTRFDLGVRLGSIPFDASYNSRVRFYFSLIGTY